MTKYVTLSLEDIYYLLNFAPAMKDITDPQRYMAIIAKVHNFEVGNETSMPPEPLFGTKEMAVGISIPYEVLEEPKPYTFTVPSHANGGNKKVPAVKFVRNITGLGLKESKDAVDFSQPMPIPAHLTKEDIKKQAAMVGITVEFY